MSTSSTHFTALNALWDEFLARWPMESLRSMSLEEYSQAGSKDCFTYWLETRTEDLGSIWGGSAFKFGVYSRKDQSDKSGHASSGLSFGPTHGWLSKYGTTVDEAFERVRGLIADIAQAAREGRLDAIEAADLGHATKWKIAFLYQDRAHPVIAPVFKRAMLDALPGVNAKTSTGQVYQQLMAAKPAEQGVLGYGTVLWQQAGEVLAGAISTDEVLSYLQAHPGLTAIKPPTKKHAGFRRPDGRELCLMRARQTPVVYFQPGPWTQELAEATQGATPKGADDTRSHGLAANAPALAAPNPAVSFSIPSRERLLELLEAYTGEVPPVFSDGSSDGAGIQPPEGPSGAADLAASRPPLNQILYGPPGTGKTYSTIDAALEILDPAFKAAHPHPTQRAERKARFDTLVRERRVRFVTFHQSFSYEDFVEGLRATTNEDTGQIRYEVVDGVFKSLCEAAAVKVTLPQEGKVPAAPIDVRGRRIWKMSLGNTLGSDASIYDECIEKGYALLGYGGRVDFTGCTTREEVVKRCRDNGLEIQNPQNDYTATSVFTFVARMKVGDLLVISDGNFKFRAIGEVSGDYKFQPHADFPDGYAQMRPVKWLRVYAPSLPQGELLNGQFSQMTLYALQPPSIDLTKLAGLLNQRPAGSAGSEGLVPGPVKDSTYEIVRANADIVELKKPQGRTLPLAMSLIQELAQAVKAGKISIADIRDKRVMEKLPSTSMDPYLVNGYNNILAPLVAQLIGDEGAGTSDGAGPTLRDARVLIIDEINRGNISRIFGELITLIEASKRAGADEALQVTLPYSKKPFSVPDNVYLIGTMNTADRSLTGMDVALRRRFEFVEMPPRPEELKGINVEGIEVQRLLEVMNERIEALLDRDHRLGHAFFMPLRENRRLSRLEQVFRKQVLPLLQEYFFDDWRRIQWVLNDHRKPEEFRFVRSQGVNTAALFGDEVNVSRRPQAWYVNDAAFREVHSYLGVIDHLSATEQD